MMVFLRGVLAIDRRVGTDVAVFLQPQAASDDPERRAHMSCSQYGESSLRRNLDSC